MLTTSRCPARLICSCTVLAAMCSLAISVAAQVPNGAAVVSRFQGTAAGAASGGLTIVDLNGTVPPVEITGLPPELTGTATGIAPEGAASVLVDGRTGHVIVGEHALPTWDTDIHVIYLAGSAVVLDEVYNLGNAPGGGGWVDQMAWFGDDIVFTVRGAVYTSGPLVGELVGILRPQLGPPGTPGTIVTVPVTTNPSGATNALAVDEKNGIAYIAKFQSQSSSQIYSVPIPGTGTPVAPVLVASLTTGILNMTYANGELLVGSLGGGYGLWRVDLTVSPAVVSAVSGQFTNANGLALDNASGDRIIADTSTAQIYRLNAALMPLALGSVNGVASGVAVRQSIATYGQPTPGANTYDWALVPNPGGEPKVGNLTFDMTLASSPGTALGVAGLSLGEASPPLPVLGISLLLDPATVVLPFTLLPAATSTIPLPIPPTVGLAGMQIYAQALFLEGSGWASSRGLRITLLL